MSVPRILWSDLCNDPEEPTCCEKWLPVLYACAGHRLQQPCALKHALMRGWDRKKNGPPRPHVWRYRGSSPVVRCRYHVKGVWALVQILSIECHVCDHTVMVLNTDQQAHPPPPEKSNGSAMPESVNACCYIGVLGCHLAFPSRTDPMILLRFGWLCLPAWSVHIRNSIRWCMNRPFLINLHVSLRLTFLLGIGVSWRLQDFCNPMFLDDPRAMKVEDASCYNP